MTVHTDPRELAIEPADVVGNAGVQGSEGSLGVVTHATPQLVTARHGRAVLLAAPAPQAGYAALDPHGQFNPHALLPPAA